MRLISTFLILVTLLVALNLAFSVPFYYSWDMDLTTVLDLFRMHDGQIPTHLNHPGLGFYGLLFWFKEIATASGFLTSAGISSLQQSLDPMVIVAEQMDTLRAFNALICVLLSVILWICFTSYSNLRKLESFLLLVLCLTLPGIWRYDILLIRTETFSLLYWALALLFTIRAAKSSSDFQLKINSLIAGFFTSLSFFTKIQSFFLLFLMPIFFLLLRGDISQVSKEKSVKPLNFKRVSLLFFLLCILCVLLPTPSYVAAWEDRNWPNKFFVVFFVAWFGICAAVGGKYPFKTRIGEKLYLRVEKRVEKWADSFLDSLPKIIFKNFLRSFAIGSCFVFLICLLMFLNPAKSFEYALLNFKMIFMRWTPYGSLGQINLIKNFAGVVVEYWSYLIVLGLAAALALSHYLKTNRYLLVLNVAALGLLGIHLILGVRGGIQDGIWVEVPIMVFVVLLIHNAAHLKKYFVPTIAMMIVFNFIQVKSFKGPGENIGYFDSNIFFEEVYPFGGYESFMHSVYPSRGNKESAMSFALKWRDWKNTLVNNFPGSGLSLKDVTHIDSNLLVSLVSLQTDSVDVRYRPDISQFILFSSEEPDLKKCKKGEYIDLVWKEKKYRGYELIGPVDDGLSSSICIVQSKQIRKNLVLIKSGAVSTLRNPRLRSDPRE